MHKVFLCFLLFLCTPYSSAATEVSPTTDPAQLVKQAQAEFAQFIFDSALAKFQKAIDLYQNSNDKKGAADTYYKLGSSFSKIGKNEEANQAFEAALKLHEELGDTKGIADDLTAIARIHLRQGDYEKCFSTSNKAVVLHEQVANKKGMADTLMIISIAHDYQGDYEKALDFNRRSFAIAEEINDKEGIAGSLATEGSIYWKTGELDVALEKYNKALAIFEEIGDLRGLGRVNGNMGLVYWNKGEMPLAIEHTNRSLYFAQKTGNKTSEATNHYNSALMLMEQGNYNEAQEKFQKSLSMGQELGDKGLMSVCLEGLGKLTKFSGDWGLALQYFEKSLTIAKEIGEKRAEAYALAGIGHVQEYYQQYESSIKNYQKAFLLYSEMDDKRGIAKAHESIGYVRYQMKRYDEALKEYFASLKIVEEIGAKWELAENYRMIGIAYREKNQLDEAEKALNKSIELSRDSDQANTLWQALYHQGLVMKRRGHPEGALQLYKESIQEIERVRSEVENIEQRAEFLQDRLEVYGEVIPVLVELKRIPEAFEYMQRSKARAFLDMLAEAEVNSDSSLNPELRDRRQEILADLMKSQKNLQDEKNKDAPDRSKIDQLTKKQNELDQQYADLILEIRNTNPMYAEVQYPQPLKLTDAQALLGDQDLLLEYFLGNSGSLLFVVSKDNVSVFNLKSESEILKLVNDLRDVMMKPDPVFNASQNTYGKYVNFANTLYAEILKPADSILQNKLRVIIAPDGALSYLPFEALLTEKISAGKINFSNLPYMARDFEIDYVPSISVLASIEKNKGKETSHPQKQLLAFADPVLKGNESGKASVVRSWAGTLTRLPFAREEVEGIARLYSDKEVSVVMGSDASEANLKKMDLKNYKKVHFASHGLIDEEKPEFSALVLTGDSQGEDGYLTMREVFDLKLDADLVVLSACKSGLGKEIRGEGITGISRAFLCAGTPSVLVSLWDVYDRSTADLMTSFYRNLETKGLNKAAALRAARLEMIQNPKFNHPYYWAPFVLIGQH
jgi:CHAT domain-containing protein/Tfp pilus assembly protein PilF